MAAERRRDLAKRLASDLMVQYLERLGVEVIFGLCGHTVIATLDAIATTSGATVLITPAEPPHTGRGAAIAAAVIVFAIIAAVITPLRYTGMPVVSRTKAMSSQFKSSLNAAFFGSA